MMLQITTKQALIAVAVMSVLLCLSTWYLTTAIDFEKKIKTETITFCEAQISDLSAKYWDAKNNITNCANSANQYKKQIMVRDILLGEILCSKVGYSDESTMEISDVIDGKVVPFVFGNNRTSAFGVLSWDAEKVICYTDGLWWHEPISKILTVGNDTYKYGVKVSK